MTNTRSRNGIMHLSRIVLGLAAAAALALVPSARTSADQAPPVNVPDDGKLAVDATLSVLPPPRACPPPFTVVVRQ